MGRKSSDNPSAATLRWRKYYEKKRLEPGFVEKDKERLKKNTKTYIESETQDQAKVRKTKNRNQMADKYKKQSEESRDEYASPLSFGKAVNRAKVSLPKSKKKRIACLKKIIRDSEITKDDLFPPKTTDSEIEKLVKDYYYNPKIVYTMPGMADTMVVRNNGDKQTVRKYYLTVFMKEAFASFVQTYGSLVKRTKFYELRPKNVLLMKETPQEVCKCILHENLRYLFTAIGGNYDGSYWNELLCDSDLRSNCWTNTCNGCKNFSNVFPDKDLEDMTRLQFWAKSKQNQIKLTAIHMKVRDVFEKLLNSAEVMYRHVHVKRVQSESFDLDKQMPGTRTTQFDFAMNFSSEMQNEVQSALWGRASIILFTIASQINDSHTSMVGVTQNVPKDKRTVFMMLQAMLDRLQNVYDPTINEIFWSDGPSSEFKNQFMVQVLKFFAKKYGKCFTWKYFASAHGKGVVDAIGGNVKSLVRMRQKANIAESVTVETPNDFITVAKQSLKDTILFEVTKDEIERFNTNNPIFETKAPIQGIAKIHIVRCYPSGHVEFSYNSLHEVDFSE